MCTGQTPRWQILGETLLACVYPAVCVSPSCPMLSEGGLKSNRGHVLRPGAPSQPENILFSYFRKKIVSLIIGFALQAYLWRVQIRKHSKYLIYFGWGSVAMAQQNVIWKAVISPGGRLLLRSPKRGCFQRDSWVWKAKKAVGTSQLTCDTDALTTSGAPEVDPFRYGRWAWGQPDGPLPCHPVSPTDLNGTVWLCLPRAPSCSALSPLVTALCL